jgi:hypothetical protein
MTCLQSSFDPYAFLVDSGIVVPVRAPKSIKKALGTFTTVDPRIHAQELSFSGERVVRIFHLRTTAIGAVLIKCFRSLNLDPVSDPAVILALCQSGDSYRNVRGLPSSREGDIVVVWDSGRRSEFGLETTDGMCLLPQRSMALEGQPLVAYPVYERKKKI